MPAKSRTPQQELPTPAAYRARVAWRERILPLIVELAGGKGRKEVAWDLDRGHSYVDSVLTESGNYRLKAEELIYFLLDDESDRLVELLAELKGKELSDSEPLTPEQELSLLKKTIRDQLGSIGDDLIAVSTKGRRR